MFRESSVGVWQIAGLGVVLSIFCSVAHAEPLTGQQVWQFMCAVCHTANGYGSPTGKNLMLPETRALTDDEMRKKIVEGNVEKGMASFAGLAPEEITGVVAYVRFLQDKAGKPKVVPQPTGELSEEELAAITKLEERGGELFAGRAQCTSCHTLGRESVLMGPALGGLASRRDAKEIRDAVLHPSKTILEGYRAKDAVLPDGTAVRARFRDETEDSVRLRIVGDDSWVAYAKEDLRALQDSKRSVMPTIFSRLDDDAQVAILAYLYSLE